jgi:NADH-quinone oxidoreductase subunit N
MNWSLAVPEIVLACLGMAILIFGVLRKQDSTSLATMFTIGAFLVTGRLVATRAAGVGFNGQFVTDAFASFNKELILIGGALALILSLDWNRK